MQRSIIIPYGIERWAEGLDTANTADVPIVTVQAGAGQTLRLNTVPWHRAARAQAADAADEPFEELRRHLVELCGPWAKLPRAFIDWYFAAIAALVERHRDDLSQRLAPFDGLYRVEDWRYAAPAPLPRAFLPVAGKADSLQVEIAFLLADSWVAVESGANGLLPAAARRRADRLDGGGVKRVMFDARDLEGPSTSLLQCILGDGIEFWRGEVLPAGPFRPELPSDF